jgi:hypothetical protein
LPVQRGISAYWDLGDPRVVADKWTAADVALVVLLEAEQMATRHASFVVGLLRYMDTNPG